MAQQEQRKQLILTDDTNTFTCLLFPTNAYNLILRLMA